MSAAGGGPLTIRAPEPDTALVTEIKDFIREFNEYAKPKEPNSNSNVNEHSPAGYLQDKYEDLEAQINQFDAEQALKYKDLIDRFTACGKALFARAKQGGGRRTKKVKAKKSKKSRKSKKVKSKKSRK